RVDELEAGLGTECHGEGDRTIQLHDGRGRDLSQRLIEQSDARPRRFLRGTRSGVTGGDCRLEGVGALRATQFFCAKLFCAKLFCAKLFRAKLFCSIERGETTTNEELIP